MADNIGSLSVQITGNAGGLATALKTAHSEVVKFQKDMDQRTAPKGGAAQKAKEFGRTFSKGAMAGMSGLGSMLSMATSAATSLPVLGLGAAGVIGVGAFVTEAIQMAAAVEDSQVTFGVMLGDMQKGKSLYADMKKLAAETPLTTGQITGAGQLLLGNGVEESQIIPTLRVLGDVAAGSGQELKDVAMLYGQVRGKARLYAEEMTQFAERNIPLQAALAKTLGVSTTEVNALVSAGKVGFPDLQQALHGMTQQGGAFFQMMETRSKTFNGLLSTLKDNAGSFMATVGQAMIEEFNLKPAMEQLSKVISLGEGGVDEIRPFLRDVRRLAEYAGESMFEFFEGATVNAVEFANQLRDVTGGMADMLNGVNKSIHWLAGTSRDFKPIKIDFESSLLTADDVKARFQKTKSALAGIGGGLMPPGDTLTPEQKAKQQAQWAADRVAFLSGSVVATGGGGEIFGNAVVRMLSAGLPMAAQEAGIDLGKTIGKTMADAFRYEAQKLTTDQMKFVQGIKDRMDPMGIVKREMEEIQRIKKLGGFAGNGVGLVGGIGGLLEGMNVENAAIADVFNKAKRELGIGGPQLAAGALRGSVEAASITTRHRLGGQGQNDVPGILKQIRDKIDQQNRANAKLADEIRNAQLLKLK